MMMAHAIRGDMIRKAPAVPTMGFQRDRDSTEEKVNYKNSSNYPRRFHYVP